jgi:nucleotide-binding universal stress UspA family protein
MNRLKNIVIAADFSACSNAALVQAVRMARWNNARLHALHVIDTLVVTDLAEARHAPLEQVRQQAVHGAAHELCRRLEEAGGEAGSSVVLGAPIDEILKKVRGVSADLLVAGARGESAEDQSVGTLAAKCLRKSPGKVMLVGGHSAKPFRTVVACVDFSDTSREVVQQTLRVASQDGGEVHLLYV